MRIAVASFSHETCTFCPSISTLEAWERGGIRYGEEVLNTDGEGPSYITGYKAGVSSEKDVELVGILRTGRTSHSRNGGLADDRGIRYNLGPNKGWHTKSWEH